MTKIKKRSVHPSQAVDRTLINVVSFVRFTFTGIRVINKNVNNQNSSQARKIEEEYQKFLEELMRLKKKQDQLISEYKKKLEQRKISQ